MIRALLTGAFAYSAEQLERLRREGVDVVWMQHEDDVLPAGAEEAEIAVCNGLFLHHGLDELPKLRLVQLTSAGFDRVDLEAMADRGITVRNARGVYSLPMAEWTLMRVMEHFKHARRFDEAQRRHEWAKDRGLRQVAGQRAAIVGAGDIGRNVGRLLSAVGMSVTGYDVTQFEAPGFDEIRLVDDLGAEIGRYDVVVLTAPALESTRRLIDRSKLEAMAPGALLVNISRGSLVDTEALADVLGQRPDLSAALDVFEQEPLPVDSRLWDMPNVAVSPHNSFVSDGNSGRMFNVIVNNITLYLADGTE